MLHALCALAGYALCLTVSLFARPKRLRLWHVTGYALLFLSALCALVSRT